MSEIKIIKKHTELPKALRVAAYARVSTEKDSMLHSLSSQISYFNDYIQSNHNWLYAGVYSDEAETGTNGKRDAFQRIIQDAKDGKIDVIITKSISRFARNTETLLKTIRELKSINVDVYFQEQNIHTLSNDGELLISILASYAQEESRICSENILWRVKKNFEEGRMFGGKDCLGYKLIEGKLLIVPEEAKLVKRIFDLYENGYGEEKIAKLLNAEGIKSYRGQLWSSSSIRKILTNYNYTGDLILQKTYRENHITKKMKINHGQKDKYLVSNDHKPIISKVQFDKVTKIRKERFRTQKSNNKVSRRYTYTGLLKCGICGKSYKHKKNTYIEYWICSTYEKLGKSYCNSKQVRDDILRNATCKALNTDKFNEGKLNEYVSFIDIFNDNQLVYHFKDGTTNKVLWKEPKRSDSWTTEKREQARLKAIMQSKKHIKKGDE